MESKFEKVTFSEGASIQHGHHDGFGATYAHHPEYEIVYILSGRGQRIIGNVVEPFERGDFVFLGPNIPHWWTSLSGGETREVDEALVVQFPEDFFSHSIFELSEFSALSSLKRNAHCGVRYEASDRIIEILWQMAEASPGLRWIRLLEMLMCLRELEPKRTFFPEDQLHERTPSRMEKMIMKLVSHLRTPPSQGACAEEMGMSRVHFSRLFKKATNMTFLEFIHHHRIQAICQELNRAETSVTDLAHDYGYDNLSTFHRAFRQVTGTHPLAYRKLARPSKEMEVKTRPE